MRYLLAYLTLLCIICNCPPVLVQKQWSGIIDSCLLSPTVIPKAQS